MSAENLQTGNAWATVDYEHRICQSFKPSADFIVNWLDLECQHVDVGIPPRAYIAPADDAGHPLPDEISHDIIAIDQPSQPFFKNRWRLKMSAYTLYSDTLYCLVTYGTSRLPPVEHDVWYQQNTGTYPAGFISKTSNGGTSWTSYPNDDLVFSLFGIPPAPAPPPEPPIKNFAVLDVIQELTLTGYKFIVTTSVPCRLFMAWTDKEPDKHRTAILRRGELWKDAIRFCFVGWHLNEQDEPGDTLVHTFIKEPWAGCETRWFAFRATVDGVWSPSVTAIFKKHRPTEGYILILEEPWTVSEEPPDFELILLERWTGIEDIPLETQVFYEPWGTFLTEYNDWWIHHPSTPVQVEFEDGIIKLTNPGYPDAGIAYSVPYSYIPLRNAANQPLTLIIDSPAGSTETLWDIGMLELWATNDEEYLTMQFPIVWGPGYNDDPVKHAYYDNGNAIGRFYMGPGEHTLDILAMWKQYRADLGLSTDPTGWRIWLIIFALMTPSPDATIILKNDYLGLYYSQYELIILEPWTVSYEPPDFESVIIEPWTASEEIPSWTKIIEEPWTQ